MQKGRVKEYSKDRGYGVIIDNRTGWQHMVYADLINLKKGQALLKGQEVEFDFKNCSQRDGAINVRILQSTVIRSPENASSKEK